MRNVMSQGVIIPYMVTNNQNKYWMSPKSIRFIRIPFSFWRRRPGLGGKLPRVPRNQFLFKLLEWALELWKLDLSFCRPLLVWQQVAPSVLPWLDYWLQLGICYSRMVLPLWVQMGYPCTPTITTTLSMHMVIYDLLGQSSRSFRVTEITVYCKNYCLDIFQCALCSSLLWYKCLVRYVNSYWPIASVVRPLRLKVKHQGH